MQKTDITLSFDDEKLEALTWFLQKDGTTPQKELAQHLEEMYQQRVPADTREYIERKTMPSTARPRPRRPRPTGASARNTDTATAPADVATVSTDAPAPQFSKGRDNA